MGENSPNLSRENNLTAPTGQEVEMKKERIIGQIEFKVWCSAFAEHDTKGYFPGFRHPETGEVYQGEDPWTGANVSRYLCPSCKVIVREG
jgi:hypothetical protein